jgi:hypothetical protein
VLEICDCVLPGQGRKRDCLAAARINDYVVRNRTAASFAFVFFGCFCEFVLWTRCSEKALGSVSLCCYEQEVCVWQGKQPWLGFRRWRLEWRFTS